ncbi:MAG: hypothetical protein A2931_01380 [Candidatus Niyogibacteria bacterium RIFCSPLOWO2_01_FULL_45_48]|uniref:Uncharacterized protein n=2 Tax=Parcubacteria group TaxID=1794811 RepID=A0A1G2R8C2_9BACT|nr:MAG: hypothetical protein A2835_00020 [Candidatus Niyogibacteria bacterium RIFCSPHIGHO2_01_FULL_45_28]OGZ30875.1 MAG: hypothetical protein A2931_01380 [Candidatus Niyogibacteria bacterium RIFCSPLOWO2_01_FULL_45_48]OHA68619.1 MAG: hypothetical protein A3D59_00640 [Candidatus Wildermuthbacteria bacterium RIFCSPHIGHO2_02_FULL_47_17]
MCAGHIEVPHFKVFCKQLLLVTYRLPKIGQGGHKMSLRDVFYEMLVSGNPSPEAIDYYYGPFAMTLLAVFGVLVVVLIMIAAHFDKSQAWYDARDDEFYRERRQICRIRGHRRGSMWAYITHTCGRCGAPMRH